MTPKQKEEYKKKNRKHHPWTFKGPTNLCSLDDMQKQSHPGIIGCFDSHYRLWQKCCQLKEPILIMEDDINYGKKCTLNERWWV